MSDDYKKISVIYESMSCDSALGGTEDGYAEGDNRIPYAFNGIQRRTLGSPKKTKRNKKKKKNTKKKK